MQIKQKLSEPDSDVDALAGLVMADPILTIRMLRPVNSVFWELDRQVTTVKETVKKVYQMDSVVTA
jgi:HD-like signal output (HDOD) protein